MSWTPSATSHLRAPLVRRPMVRLPDHVLARPPNCVPQTSLDARIPTTQDLPDYFSDSDDNAETMKAKPKNVSSPASPRSSRASRGRQSARPSSPRKAKVHPIEVLQCISCTPGLREKSIEELRVETYAQSWFATGRPPNPVTTTRMVLPPGYAPYRQTSDAEHDADVVMSSKPGLASMFTFTSPTAFA